MEVTFRAKKCHSIRREGRTVRGFKAITIKLETP